MTAQKLVSMLDTLDNAEVFFGPQGFKHITSLDELVAAQLGFGTNASDQLVVNESTAESKGRWQSSWQVFARDTELGDPYFVDTLQDELPVYTRFLGDEGWEQSLVAQSLEAYILCLQLLSNYGTQMQAQFVPDHNSIVDKVVLAKLQQELSDISGAEHFWQLFMQCYQDWLIED